MRYRHAAALGLLGLGVLISLGSASTFAANEASPRRVVPLDGTWQIAEGGMDAAPKEFSHNVPVPGLVDMAQPAFKDVGKRSSLRQAFWYRRTFKVEGSLPEVAILKLQKACFGTKVWLNGQVVGEHVGCFTPALLDVRAGLKGDGQENELLVRVGANRESVSAGVPSGWDFEKYLFVPGIYDTAELILSGAPRIVNLQTVPDIEAKTVRVVAEIAAGGKPCDFTATAEVTEAKSGRVVGTVKAAKCQLDAREQAKVDLTLSIPDCRLWSPEDPFLYRLTFKTGSDQQSVRFGMRSFRFDPATKRAVLNGKPYYLRGTNVTMYRFFEDASRGDRPWRSEWVRRLHQKYKTMHWNSIRYCIGFPPEAWYDIADEEGLLIQDEFPIWLLGEAPEKPVAEKIAPQYVEWMRERWNHPCVVIWDAQNESNTNESGKALQMVRKLDLSNRPWENGWAAPQASTDCVESHPYLFIRTWEGRAPFRLHEIEHVSGVPGLNDQQRKLPVPIIINEYDWLWLNRDGSPTCLTDKVYESLLGPKSTVEQRRVLHARYVAALTEFWRCHREAAGVLHFCGLGYSRSGDKPRPEGGATSDDFIDLEKLVFEPNFEKYVREAFNPLGLMLDFWKEEIPAGTKLSTKVFVINDLEKPWQGDVRLTVRHGDTVVSHTAVPCSVESYGRQAPTLTITMPEEPGNYVLEAEVRDHAGTMIHSLRDVRVVAGKK